MNNPLPLPETTTKPWSLEAASVRQALLEHGLETPMQDSPLDYSEKFDQIRESMTCIMRTLGLDLQDDSLQDTPNRIAKMYLNEIFCGLDYENFPKITAIDNKMGADDVITVDNIELISTCEHHFVTIDGKARVAYIPDKKVIGLSKINRVTGFFAQRPQVQERLTKQIMVALQTLLGSKDVAVSIEARHYCVKARGVKDASSFTSTRSLGGQFRENQDLRREFLS